VVSLTRHVRHPHAHPQGVEEAKEELMEVVEFLKNPDRFNNLGGKMPKGVLLCAAAPALVHSHYVSLPLHTFLFLFIPFSSSSYLSLPLHPFLFLFIPFSSSSSVSLALLHHLLHLPYHIISLSYPPSLTTTAAAATAPLELEKRCWRARWQARLHASRVTCHV